MLLSLAPFLIYLGPKVAPHFLGFRIVTGLMLKKKNFIERKSNFILNLGNKNYSKIKKKKNRLYPISCKQSHSDIRYKKCKQCNNILTHVKQQSKQNYFQYHLELNKNNTRNIWKTINSIIVKPSSGTMVTNIKCPVSNNNLFSPKTYLNA